MGAEASSAQSEDTPTDSKSGKDCLDLARQLFLSGRYQQCLRALNTQVLNKQPYSLLQHLHAANAALCRSLVELSSPSSSKTAKDAFLKEHDIYSERLKSIPLSLRLQATYNIAAGYLRMRMPNAAAECCTRCLGGILQAGNVKGEDGDLCSAFSAATALEILLRRVCARGRDVHVGGRTLLNLIRLGCILCASYINAKLWMGARSLLSAMNVVRAEHPFSFQQECAAHLASQDEVGGDDLFLSPFPDMGTFLDPLGACIETLVGLVFLAEKDFEHAVQAFQKSIVCIPGYYPSQWCLSCLSLMPDLNISEKACDGAINSVTMGQTHIGFEEGRYESRAAASSKYCFDDSQVGILLQGCLALNNGELNSALTSFREANRRFKKSLLAAYGVAITLRTGGEEGPARDILLKLVEEMDQLSERSSSNTNGGGELSSPNGVCVGMDQIVVPVTMSQVLWQITQSSMAIADYKMALASLNRLLDIKEKVKSERVDNGGVMNVGNPKLFVFYAGSRDPNLLQVVRAKVYALLQHGKASAALECLESSRESDIVDPALLLYEADTHICLEMEEEQDHILSCVTKVVSVLEARHRMFCKNKMKSNSSSSTTTAEQQQCHEHGKTKKMKNNDGGGMTIKKDENSGIELPCTRSLAVAHNNLALALVLVLWRLGRHKAAAELWLETRGYLPYLSIERGQQLLQQARQHRATFISCNDDTCKGNTGDGGGISAIVNATGEEGCVPASQECALDVMILSFWIHCNGRDGWPHQ